MIIVNFKCYDEATADKALKLAKICEKVSKKTKVKIIIAVQATDVYRVAKEVSIDVYGQHADSVHPGAFTGHVTVDALKFSGAKGLLLNHSEKKISLNEIEEIILMAKKNKMKVVVCAVDADIGEIIGGLLPDYVAIEPPELIGGNVSVSTAKPELIEDAFERIPAKDFTVGLIVGAGVKDKKDVVAALQYGACGILVSSGVVLAKDPEKVLLDLCAGFGKG